MSYPNMELFLVGVLGSMSLVVWATMLLATYTGLRVSRGAVWNPRLHVASTRSVSAYKRMSPQQSRIYDDDDDDDDDDDGDNNRRGGKSSDEEEDDDDGGSSSDVWSS